MTALRKFKHPNPWDNTMKPEPDIVRGARTGNYEEVKQALKFDPSCINATDAKDMTAAHYVALKLHYPIAELLFSQTIEKVDLNIPDYRGRTALDLVSVSSNDEDFKNLFLMHQFPNYKPHDEVPQLQVVPPQIFEPNRP